MGLFIHFIFSIILVTCASSLIIPDEITSLLSLVYSNIPPIKKGTDSRVGVGFRLGPHADFQVVLELGPQSNTQPIGPSADTKRRRHSEQDSSYSSYKDTSIGSSVPVQTNALPLNWLSKWRSALRGQFKMASSPSVVSNHEVTKPATAMTVEASPDVVSHLSQLFVRNDSLSAENSPSDASTR